MTNEKLNAVRLWLKKAAHDLASAKALAAASEYLLDTAIYHCQQAAEKAVKAFLVFHDVRFEKTHNIALLVGSATKVDPRFASRSQAAEFLTPYASLFRYPDEEFEPSRKEFDEALQRAEELFAFVLSLLPQGFTRADQ